MQSDNKDSKGRCCVCWSDFFCGLFGKGNKQNNSMNRSTSFYAFEPPAMEIITPTVDQPPSPAVSAASADSDVFYSVDIDSYQTNQGTSKLVDPKAVRSDEGSSEKRSLFSRVFGS